jgi:hypothetical protein
MYCPNCGAQLDDGTAFCTYCGTSISEDGAPGVTAEETLSEEDNVSRLEAAAGQEPEPEPEPKPAQKAEALPEDEIEVPPPGDIDTTGIEPKKSYKKLIVAIVFIVLILCSLVCCCALMLFMSSGYMGY